MKKLIIITCALLLAACNANTTNSNINDSLKTDTTKIDSAKMDVTTSLMGDADKGIIALLKDIQVDSETFKKTYKNSRLKGDEFSKSKYLFDKSSPQFVNMNGIFCYVTDDPKFPMLHLDIQYYAEDWLFIKGMTFNIDGENFDYEPPEFKRDNGNQHIWEWSDDLADENSIPFLVKIALGKKAKVKYMGSEYYKVVNITNQQQLAIKNMLVIYKGMLLGYKK